MGNASAMDSQFLDKLTRIIQEKMTDSQFGVSELAREMGMSRSNLHRRVHGITGKTVTALISEARLKRALELLKEGLYTVSEVSWRAGFGSVTYFDKCFHDYYGFPPGEAKNKDLSKIPAGGKQNEEVVTVNHKKRNRILIGALSVILLASMVVLLILVRPFKGERKEIEKSIAVLPFRLLSNEPDKQYLADGMMGAIVMHLSKIEDLHVMSETSTQQYKGSGKTMPEIGRELEAEYLLEGSFQKSEDNVRLIVQLIYAREDDHIWSNEYDRNWNDIFAVQSEVAQAIAEELKAVITPEEKQRIEKKPTGNMEAYNLFLRGSELKNIAETTNDKILLKQATDFFRKAIQIDSTFASAYIQLGWAIASLINDYDSALYFANRALHFDSKNSGAYCLKGWVFTFHSIVDKLNEAEKAFNLAIRYNPSSAEAYVFMGAFYHKKGDYPRWIEYFLRGLKIEKDPWGRWNIVRNSYRWLNQLGFYEEALFYSKELIDYNNDSLNYYWGKTGQQWSRFHYDSAYAIARIAVESKKWPDTFNPLSLANICMEKKDFPAALKHAEEYIESQEKQGKKVTPNGMIGFIYLKNGQKEKATYHFNGYISNQLKLIGESLPDPNFWNYFNLTYIYSAMGEKEKAVENFRKAIKCKDTDSIPFSFNTIFSCKYSPMYETIREEPGFRTFIQQKEDKYEADREKIKKLFREVGVSG